MPRRRTSLREFQQALSRRLAVAQAQAADTLLLAAESGGSVWLLRLPDAGEVIMPIPKLEPAPLTQRWYRGIANVRGNLYSVIDFAAFMGRENTLATPTARLLLVGQRYGLNAGLIFWRVLGLRDSRDLTRRDIDGPHATAWSRTEFQDAGGQVYRELAVSDLMRHPDFIAVGR